VSLPNVWLENVICADMLMSSRSEYTSESLVVHCFVLLAFYLYFCLLSVCLSDCLTVCLSVCLSVSVDGQAVSLFYQRVSSRNSARR